MAKKRTIEKLQLEMKDTLDSMGCMEVVSVSSRNGDIRFLTRVNDEPRWLRILNEFLDIGKKYFLNEGRLVFGWVLIFESDESLDEAVQAIRKLFTTCVDVVENAGVRNVTNQGDERGMIEVPLPSSAGYTSEQQKRVHPLR